MSFAEALDYFSHPRRWTIFGGYEVPAKRTKGLLDRLTPEQREKLLAYRGPEASGDQSLPKRKQNTKGR
jgi:hypothetical protein